MNLPIDSVPHVAKNTHEGSSSLAILIHLTDNVNNRFIIDHHIHQHGVAVAHADERIGVVGPR
jgi:hypothetical protein